MLRPRLRPVVQALVLALALMPLAPTLAAELAGTEDLGPGDTAAATEAPSAEASAVAAPAAAGVATNGSALPEAMALLDDQRRLGRGDQLSFRVVEDRKEARRLVVTDSGELEVPYIGRVKGEGRTCRELAVEIKGLLEKEYYHQATVILAVDQLSASRGRVYLVGQVRMAGPQPIPTDEEFTVSKAILRAGGFSDFADRRRVKIMRKGEADPAAGTLVVDVAAVLEKGRAEKDVVLRPDDLVFVPSRLVNF